jgi:alpha-beta hydrolase superfamily lysophospholipase
MHYGQDSSTDEIVSRFLAASSAWRRVTIALMAVAAILLLGLCGSVLAVGLRLSTPYARTISLPPESLAGAETVQISSASGSSLRGWWLGGQPHGGAVVLMHGVHSTRLAMVRRAARLHDLGFAVLLFDFQAHGESPGRHITFGHLEALDAAAAVDFARRHAPDEKIAVIGVSLGGAATLLGPKPLKLDALVLESVYPDIDAALGNRLRVGLGPTAGRIFPAILTPAFELLLPPIIGVRPSQLRPIAHIGEVTEPLLMLSGDIDNSTTLAEARMLFDRAPQPKQFVAVPGAGHVNLESYDPDGYWRVVLPFLESHLRPR